ncbi:MAG: cytochrome C [Sinimarinibacterium sp.]|jgi:hypothetical protein
MKKIALLVVFILGALAAWAWPRMPWLQDAAFWQQQASPGPLSPGHAFLEDNCAACHTRIKGVEAGSCIVCHANDTALLQRQATAFHASIGDCAQCHREHDPAPGLSPGMNHERLAQIGLRQLEREAPDSDAALLHHQLAAWVARDTAAGPAPDNPHLASAERVLECTTCHASKDRHGALFGRDCAQCHATTQWTLAEYQHPPPSSTDCAQCHKAPPSHYMEHFKMVSMTVAGQPFAQVRQCYLCHQTTAWNDIRNVGVYKHH